MRDRRTHVDVPVHSLDGTRPRTDAVVVEEPLAVHVAGPTGDGEVLAVTMRTPGADLDLAVGLCWGEGLLRRPEDLLDAARCPGERAGDTPPVEEPALPVRVRLRTRPSLDHLARRGVMTSACGVCGRTEVDDLAVRVPGRPSATTNLAPGILAALPDRLRAAQAVFGLTGGLHAVARFDADGTLVDLAEDVGRHNAFDKVVGRAVRAGDVDWSDQVVLLSGRASYELLAKAAMVRAGVVAAIGAPSSLAIEVAERFGITLVGFLRGGGGNVHTHPARLGLGALR